MRWVETGRVWWIRSFKKSVGVFVRWTSMFRGGVRWLRSSERFKFLATSFSSNARTRYSFCTSTKSSNNNGDNKNTVVDERYRQLENLDMVTAAKILFTDPPKKRKFGYPLSFLYVFSFSHFVEHLPCTFFLSHVNIT